MLVQNNRIYFILGIFLLLSSCTEPKMNPSLIAGGFIYVNARACCFEDVESIQKKLKIKIDIPTKREIDEIKTIMSYIGLPQNFKIFRGDISNAMATMYENERLIIYNKSLFTDLDALDSTYWSSMFIIAHEIGHHLAYNISDTINPKKSELEADIFAGSVLYKMGADSNQVLSALKSHFISNFRDTKTHPSKNKRIEAVKNSWFIASKLQYQSAIPPPPFDEVTSEDEFSNKEFKVEEYLSFDVSKSEISSLEIHSKGVIIYVELGKTDENFDNYKKINKILINITETKDSLWIQNKVIGSNIWFYITPAIYELSNAERMSFYLLLKPGRRIDFATIASSPNLSFLSYVKPSEIP